MTVTGYQDIDVCGDRESDEVVVLGVGRQCHDLGWVLPNLRGTLEGRHLRINGSNRYEPAELVASEHGPRFGQDSRRRYQDESTLPPQMKETRAHAAGRDER